MSTIQNRPFTNAILGSIDGLQRMSEAQKSKLDRALDVDGNGEVSYLPEFGSAQAFINSNYTKSDRCTGVHLDAGVKPADVISGMEQRKAVIADIADRFADQTFDDGRKMGTPARYFGGFFDSSKRTLKDEIRDVAHGMRTFGQLDRLAKVLDAAPKNAAGKIDFAIWDAHVFGELQSKLGVQGAPRLVHGSMWGDL